MEQEQQKRTGPHFTISRKMGTTPEEQQNLQSQSALRWIKSKALISFPQGGEISCEYCGCETNKDVIKAAFWADTGLVLIEDIPARLCQGCGEQFFEAEIAQRIQQVITGVPQTRKNAFGGPKCPVAKARRQIRVPVYSLSQTNSIPDTRSSILVENRESSIEPPEGTFLCKYCESETVTGLVKSAFWTDEALLAVENIPARICNQCSQLFYDNETAEKIASLAKGRLLPGTTRRDVLVPVYSLAD